MPGPSHFAQLLDRSGGPSGRWKVISPGHPPVGWEGFATGPVVLSADELDQVSRALLGIPADQVAAVAAAEIVPFSAAPGERPPAVLLHSATASLKGFEGDLTDLREGRTPWDVPGYLEARQVALAEPGDLAVGRTAAWLEAVTARGVEHLVLPDLDHYYLTQALLVAAVTQDPDGSAVLEALVAWLRAHPDAVLRMYALDREAQVLLVWLRRRAGLERLRTDANSPAVADRWNAKAHLHPAVDDAAALELPEDASAPMVLAAEQRLSGGFRRLGLQPPVLPGYTVPRPGRSEAQFVADALRAAGLLVARHGIGRICLKPSEAGDGARIVPGLDAADTDRLEQELRLAHRHGDDYLLEAHVEFAQFEAAGRRFALSPSGHVRGGHVAPGITVQLMDGSSWVGNAYVDEASCGSVGLSGPLYRALREALLHIRDAFHGEAARAEGVDGGLVTGGIDFAVGRVGGRYGQAVLGGAIDFNLSSNGGEYLRAFLDTVSPLGHRYAATRVYRPAPDTGLVATDALVQQLVQQLVPAGQVAATVAAVPRSWGMVAVTGPDTLGAIELVEALVAGLAGRGLAAT